VSERWREQPAHAGRLRQILPIWTAAASITTVGAPTAYPHARCRGLHEQAVLKGHAKRSPEERSETARKAAETRAEPCGKEERGPGSGLVTGFLQVLGRGSGTVI
jgi:hypothetical protein